MGFGIWRMTVWVFAAEIFRYEQADHVVDGLRVCVRINAGGKPVGIRAGEVFLQRVKVAAAAELNGRGQAAAIGGRRMKICSVFCGQR